MVPVIILRVLTNGTLPVIVVAIGILTSGKEFVGVVPKVPFDDKQQRGHFVWQEGLLFNAVPIVASTIQAAAVLHYTIYP